jgi:TolA-binding protein
VGGALGAGVHEAYDRARDRRAEHAAIPVVAPPPATTPPATLPPPATPPPAVRAPEPTTASEARRPPAKAEHSREVEIRERDRGLGAERALIEQARTALSRDKSGDALAALERHARDFPQGELEEERESLQVHALVGLERYDQARKVGARFHRRFPRSIFGAVVDEVLRSIP